MDSVNSFQADGKCDAPIFTVLTPTYNRRKYLPAVYNSLREQTINNFEWLIIDGGSDDTQTLAEKWKLESDFRIRYYKQTSSGLHGAYNEGAALANGILLVIMHSDDSCVPRTLQSIYEIWNQLPYASRGKYSGIWARCMDQTGAMIGPSFGDDIIDSTYHEVIYKRGFDCELFPIVRAEIMREFPFPDFQGVRFIPEGYIWAAIGRKYKTIFVNTPLRQYTTLAESVGDQDKLTDPINLSKNAPSIIFYCRDILISDGKWMFSAPMTFLKISASCSFYSFINGVNLKKQFEGLPLRSKILYVLGMFVGFYKYRKTKLMVGA